MSRPYVPIECRRSTSLAHICGELWRLVQPRPTARNRTVRWEALRWREKRLTQAVAVETHDAMSDGVSAEAALLTESSVCVGNALVELKIIAATMRARLQQQCLAALPRIRWLKGSASPPDACCAAGVSMTSAR
jgi:hypothetical protein